MPLCKHCGQALWGQYITALGASWHPEHFLCAACGQAVREPEFQVIEGQPYHETCYLAYRAPRCAHCGQPITESYLEFEGRTYHETCYREHVGPRCAYCHLPIKERYQKFEGHDYHTTCYREHIAARCVYCHEPLLHEYVADAWGQKFCSKHQNEFPRCSFCSRLVPPEQQTSGWDAYGVIRCSICHVRSIEVVEQAQPLFQECKKWIARQGFRFNQLPLSLDLRDRPTLMSMLRDRSINHPLGVTLSSRKIYNGSITSNQIEGVAVLQGMPPTLFAGVVMHELGHVWLTVHRVENLPLWAEEGFCQLLSYYYYCDLNTPESRFHMERMESATDPIYGQGFRAMRSLAEKRGFQQLVEIVERTKKLPVS